ncbi:winged helix-turn-helix domain-containing protein [Actinomycetospora termitidis]|uniref:assimilatory sulfite reductase (ferredoxin) n=1 Tax=Actinomycetospora termitidis TaxID=3053470 RepID=A0ABT7M9E6_9PSEU|nr:winged helix-turn-helix domain-containing protein [Actinomycetospora sp. Odt1-22]MDL5157294.1 winged helix-turn-helix domain-containing protein [Actinomycetospora sp. Odt1-22]
MHLLVLTGESRLDVVLPGLAVLPDHRVALGALTAAEAVTSAVDVDAVLLDARTRPFAAAELAATVDTVRPGLPVVVVVGPDAAFPVEDDVPVDTLLLPDASPAEVAARLRLVARPVPPAPRPRRDRRPAAPPPGALVVDELVVDTVAYQAWLAGRPLALARRELELLAALAARPGRPMSRTALLRHVWGRDYDGSARTVDVHVRQLRRVLGPGHREMIRTLRGVGYALFPTAGPAAAAADAPGRVAAPLRPEEALDAPSAPARPGGRDAPGDVVASKRAGLPLDLDAIAEPTRLGALERYSLKTLGACSEGDDGLFLLRARTRGRIPVAAARALAALLRERDLGPVHLTTRQQLELHDVPAGLVVGTLDALHAAGLDTAATCGHTVRGVTSCPDAGVSAEEPFDCTPDADRLTDSLLRLGPELNTRLPQRFTISLGGCPGCRGQAKVSDVGLVSVLDDEGRPGYELWVGGGLGRSRPTLATRLAPFVPRDRLLPAVHAVLAVFLAHGAFENPNRARLKFLVARLGLPRFRALVVEAETDLRHRPWPAPAPLPEVRVPGVPEGPAPPDGWGDDVRPQRTPGLATVTVTVPLGSLSAAALEAVAEVAGEMGDGSVRLTREQNVVVRDVPVGRVEALAARVAAVGLAVHTDRPARDVRACVGAPSCALAITPTRDLARGLWHLPALRRNSGVAVSVSGCPASCARHQAADLGLAGNLVSVRGHRVPGYRVHLGGDLGRDRLGTVLGRVAADQVTQLVDQVVRTWEGVRVGHESLADTVARTGLEPFVSALRGLPGLSWEAGDDERPSLPLVTR